MNNFHFTKIIASVSPLLAKETVLSKIINMVDVFSITLSHGFDDNNKKYIETLMKLDNSKTVLLETRGHNIRVKNTTDIDIKVGQEIIVDYSEFTQESDTKIYVDYSYLGKLLPGEEIFFEGSQALLEVISTGEDFATCHVKKSEKKKVFQYDRVTLHHHETEDDTLSSQDEKDIRRGLSYGTHVLALSACHSGTHVQNCKDFLAEEQHPLMKVFAKIETASGLKHLDSITDIADGIILVLDALEEFRDLKNLTTIMTTIRQKGLPLLVTATQGMGSLDYPFNDRNEIARLCDQGVAGIMLETLITENTVFETIEQLGNVLSTYELEFPLKEIKRFETKDNEIRDYLIYSVYRVTTEMEIKAIICFTENGYTVARIASLNPKVPIIAFTKEQDTYRFLNLVWGVKGYRISQSFDYESLKKIGKEMIRIIFKGNISLDDKVLIIQTTEDETTDEKREMNGLELYNFKNI